jgi:hypothetical protein
MILNTLIDQMDWVLLPTIVQTSYSLVEQMEFKSNYAYKAGILLKESVLWQQNHLPVPSVPGSIIPLQPLIAEKLRREKEIIFHQFPPFVWVCTYSISCCDF